MDSDDDKDMRSHFDWQTHFEWKQDRAGVRHWVGRLGSGDSGTSVYDAAMKCLDTRPARPAVGDDEPAWFWFNETPAPIAEGDGARSLSRRWIAWREAYQAGGPAFLDLLRAWSVGPVTNLPEEPSTDLE
jgi:hypothetical protein